MYGKGRGKQTIRFALKPSNGASKVEVSGDFSDWHPLTMRRQKDGTYVRHVDADRDTVQYKFLIDGQWITDPDHDDTVVNPFGTDNSVGHID